MSSLQRYYERKKQRIDSKYYRLRDKLEEQPRLAMIARNEKIAADKSLKFPEKKAAISASTATQKAELAALKDQTAEYEKLRVERVSRLRQHQDAAREWIQNHTQELPLLAHANIYERGQMLNAYKLRKEITAYSLQSIKDLLIGTFDKSNDLHRIRDLLNSATDYSSLFKAVLRLQSSTYIPNGLPTELERATKYRTAIWLNLLLYGHTHDCMLPAYKEGEVYKLSYLPQSLKKAFIYKL